MRALLALIVSIGLMPSKLSAQVPDNLITDGILPITPALRQDVGRCLEFRTAGFNGWHPVRREKV